MSTTDPVSTSAELSREQACLVRDHLKEIIVSPAFAGSKRAQGFLQLITEHAMAGRLDNLRERMIGAEMFGRPVDYDTANDAVVRVKATEVRRKLAQYYQETETQPAVRIELPVGSYVPRFRWESLERLSEPPPTNTAPVVFAASASASASATTQDEPAEQEGTVDATGEPASRTPRVLVGILAGLAILAATSYIGFKVWPRGSGTKPEIHSIAVLPLQNLSGDSQQDYFADGMTEELISDLGQVSALRVISRTSAMSYKGTKKTLPEIARELAVDAVVEGSVLQEGRQVRITAQLIDARNDQHIWSRNYVRDLTSVLALQGEVAQAIADEISIQMTPQELARLARVRTVHPEAQELYLQATQRLNAGDPRDAIGYLQKAIDKDPNYAQAHAALARSYGWMGEAGWMPYSEAFPRQKTEAIKAVQLDDALPEGHVELANAAMNLDWDWSTQGNEFKRALELNPSSAQVRWAYSGYLERTGHIAEAISESKVALQLDPVSSRTSINSAWNYYFARQYDKSLEQMQRVSELQNSPAEIAFPFGAIYVEKGRYEEAIQKFQELGGAPHALGHMGNAYARMGKVIEAREMISKLQDHVQKTGVGRYEIALVYAGLGEKNEAFAWLEKSFVVRDKGLTYLKIDPCLDPLRSDSRFQDLVRRVGLPL